MRNFRGNKRGWWSFVIFMVLFVISLFAEFLANDRPILVSYDGGYYMPVFKTIPRRRSAAISRQRRTIATRI